MPGAGWVYSVVLRGGHFDEVVVEIYQKEVEDQAQRVVHSGLFDGAIEAPTNVQG